MPGELLHYDRMHELHFHRRNRCLPRSSVSCAQSFKNIIAPSVSLQVPWSKPPIANTGKAAQCCMLRAARCYDVVEAGNNDTLFHNQSLNPAAGCYLHSTVGTLVTASATWVTGALSTGIPTPTPTPSSNSTNGTLGQLLPQCSRPVAWCQSP